MKRQPAQLEGGDICKLIYWIWGKYTKIYKRLIQLNIKKRKKKENPNNSIKKQAEELNRYFSKDGQGTK